MDSWEPTWPGRPPGAGSLGQRIAALRVDRGWTQQQLADRLGISRVAVSHLETDINTPGERTVALLAGLFRLEPHDLVAGTSYPMAKSDRLPLVVARWTEVEHRLALLARDLWWLEGVEGAVPPAAASVVERVLGSWEGELAKLVDAVVDPGELATLEEARRVVADRVRAARS
ncbi:MAG: helix-turn-helix transcriptional regulator [Acidimicrobiales bacterium]|nr:helix-turn-helix transcriptional regulator [Acidimicrobiales bacterium]